MGTGMMMDGDGYDDVKDTGCACVLCAQLADVRVCRIVRVCRTRSCTCVVVRVYGESVGR